MAGYSGNHYSEHDLQMINDLKVLKGKLKGRDPTEQEVDKAPNMENSRAYKARFGPSWAHVLFTVRGSYVTDEGDEEAAAKYAKKIEKEIPAPSQVSAVAPELEEMFKEIEHGTPIDATPEMPKAKAEAAKKEIEASMAPKPEKVIEAPKTPKPEKAAEVPKASKPDKVVSLPGGMGLVIDPETETKKVSEKPKETPKEVVKEKPKAVPGLNLVNLTGQDVILVSETKVPKKIVSFGTVEEKKMRFLDEKTSDNEFGGVPVFMKKFFIQERTSPDLIEFPDPRKGTYYIVYEETARELQKTGRWTEDLLFPAVCFADNERLYIHQLEVINS